MAEDPCQSLTRVLGGDVDRLAAEGRRLGEPVGVHIAHDHGARTQQLRADGRGEAHGARTGDVDRRARADAGGDGAVVARREDVRQHRQVEDLLHRLIAVREAKQVPVGVGDHDVLGLAADPAAHVDVAVGAAGPIGVHVQADLGLALLAVDAAAAGDVERDGAEIALLDELDARPDLDHLAGDLVAQDQALGGGGAAADHVLVGTADVGGDDLQDGRVGELPAHVSGVDAGAVVELEVGEFEIDDLDLAGAFVGDAAVVGHSGASSSKRPCACGAGHFQHHPPPAAAGSRDDTATSPHGQSGSPRVLQDRAAGPAVRGPPSRGCAQPRAPQASASSSSPRTRSAGSNV